MFRMEVDSPPSESYTVSSEERIVERLVQLGVPEDTLEQLQVGLVAYVKDNNFRIPELVSAILPADEEAVESVLEAQAEASKAVLGPNIEDEFRESMVWLQWLMLKGEPAAVLKHLAKLNVGQRGFCGAVWGNNDIAYRCRTCEHDPTCAICVPCFQNGNHKDHDYSIIYTGGGCCDCGDVTAWKREGFCLKHKGAEQMQPLPEEFANTMRPILDSLLHYWKNKLLIAESLSHGRPRADDNVSVLRKVVDELTSAIVKMLLEFCECSESLLSFIAGRVFSFVGLLEILVKAERFLDADTTRRLHELLLKLLGEPQFKYEFAKAFLSYYPVVVSETIKECDDNIFKSYPLLSTFSVQIFTVPTLTPHLVKEMNLLTTLLECLWDIFISCAGKDGRLQVNKWANLNETTLRVIGDIRFVVSHSMVPKYITQYRRDILRTWMKLLAFVQGMNPLKRETGIHIEEENENMSLPFVLGHSIANIHSLLVGGAFSIDNGEDIGDETFINMFKLEFEDQDSLRHAKVGRVSQESSVGSLSGRSVALDSTSKAAEVISDMYPIPSAVSWFTFECLRTLENWLGLENTSGPTLGVMSQKTSDRNFFALKRTLSKFRKGRSIFKTNNSATSNIKLVSSSDVHVKQCISSVHGNLYSGVEFGSGRSTGQDTVSAAFDDGAVEGEYVNELEAFRVLNLSDWPEIMYDVSLQDISVHIPLHRLLSLILQRALIRCHGESASSNLSIAGSVEPLSSIYHDFFGYLLGGCHPYGFSAFIMEHPLRIRVFCAEVHAGMWRKNGDAAILSCEWYRSVLWYEQGLELDLFLLQCCAALAPADLYVNRIIERFGLSNYLDLNLERSNEFEPVLVQEMLTLIIQIVKERRFCGLTSTECLQRELIHKLSTGDATHSQLVKSLPRDLAKIDKLKEILDTIAVYSNPSGMNQGMYKLRLTYWRELDLYHPRWNSRDLQVAEERYLRFCNVSALITQLPKWTKPYHPLNDIARVATCKAVLRIVRAVLFYAVYTDKLTVSRAPDGVLLTALHLLSLALDICYALRESGERSCYIGDSIPLLAYAGEEIFMGSTDQYSAESLLSLLVSLMRIQKKENPDNFSFSWIPLIENLLKRFAELDSECMSKLQQFAPEVVDQLSSAVSDSYKDSLRSTSDDKHKAKARERQAAMMEKMRAQQSKFLASIKSTSDDGLESTEFGKEVSPSTGCDDAKESALVVCSLCRDPNSPTPLSFLILLQKSRLLKFADKSPPSWEQGHHPEEHASTSMDSDTVPSLSSVSSSLEPNFSSQLMSSIQNAANELAPDGQPREVGAFLEFIKAQSPSVRNLHLRGMTNDTWEEQIYQLIWEGMLDKSLNSDGKDGENVSTDGTAERSKNSESIFLGKYLAALSKERSDKPSASDNVRSRNNKARSSLQAMDGFGPSDCSGIHVSSCGHAVHQGCLDRYLLSLKERYIRRIVFEGGHIVDPDQGEFLCPVCRGLANSVLPAVFGDSKKVCKPTIASASGNLDAANLFISSSTASGSLRLRHALSLLQTAADVSGRTEILMAFPMQENEAMKSSLESVSRVLYGMYFPGKENISQFHRASRSMIMWDTLKYSLTSTEIAARSRKTSLTPNYGLGSLYKELKCSSGFVLSLLLQIAQSTRTKNPRSVLSRLRGTRLFAESICSGVSSDSFPNSSCTLGGNMLGILENAEVEVQYPDIQFWKWASDPILAHDAFSSLMWMLFCLPYPFLLCEETFLSLVHLFYVVTVIQALLGYCGKQECDMTEFGHNNCLITDICKILGEYGFVRQYFVSNHANTSCKIKDVIRSLSFPYLRRCTFLWGLVNSATSAPFGDDSHVFDCASPADHGVDSTNALLEELSELEELEKTFKLPSLDDIINNNIVHSVVSKWLLHFCKQFDIQLHKFVLYSTPAVPLKLVILPRLYQDLLQRYIKQRCPDCGVVQEEPALCLLCGRLCSPNWKACCRGNGCQTHAKACGAGTGVFLLIRKTTILLQRSARQAPWPSPYLDIFGEEDIEMHRGKPLYLNEERYAALTHMVASHGLDRSPKVLRQTTIGSFFML